MSAEDLAQVLQGSGVRLAVLTACQSATGATTDPFSSTATRLIRSGVDAVVAMSASVLVVTAARDVEAFYRALAAGTAAPVAHEYARQALHDDPARHRFQRRGSDEAAPVRLRDWWLPHFYQQRTLALRPTAPPSAPPHQAPKLSDLPNAPRYGFSGRARELHQIERWLIHHRLVVIRGFGGMGKTALAAEAASWLSRTGLYQGACLSRFTDDTASGRNRSLLASLDYPLRRLTDAQRALLPCLAVFEGGASEDDLLAITEIPRAEWTTLRPALEQAALLTPEWVHDDVSVPFLRFHPVLVPSLRSQSGADDEALRERYTRRYHELHELTYEVGQRDALAVGLGLEPAMLLRLQVDLGANVAHRRQDNLITLLWSEQRILRCAQDDPGEAASRQGRT